VVLMAVDKDKSYYDKVTEGIVTFNDTIDELKKLMNKYIPDIEFKIEDMKNSDTFKKNIYRLLSKEMHPDLHPGDLVREEDFKILGLIFDDLEKYYNKENFNITEEYNKSEDKMVIRSKSDVFKYLQSKRNNYKYATDKFLELYNKLDNDIMFLSLKEAIDKAKKLLNEAREWDEYLEVVDIYQRQLNEFNCNEIINDKIIKFISIAKEKIYSDIEAKYNVCLNIIKKDAIDYCIGGNGNYFRDSIDKIRDKELYNITNLDELRNYINNNDELLLKKQIMNYYNNLIQLEDNYKNANYSGINIEELLKYLTVDAAYDKFIKLKDKIVNRQKYYHRVCKKLNKIINECAKDNNYSFTMEYLNKELRNNKDILRYYDKSDDDLKKFEEYIYSIINNKKEEDLDKANNKKEKLKDEMKVDFKKNIFPKVDYLIMEDRINNIKTFGEFAKIEEHLISEELQRLFKREYKYLRDSQMEVKDKKRLELIWQATNKLDELLKVYLQVKKIDKKNKYDKMVIVEKDIEKEISYKDFAKRIRKIGNENIDYLNDDLYSIYCKLNNKDSLMYVNPMMMEYYGYKGNRKK